MVSLLVSIGTTEKPGRNPTPLKLLCLHKGQPSSLPGPQCLALLWFSRVIPLPLHYGRFSPPLSQTVYFIAPPVPAVYLTSFLIEKKKHHAILPEQDHLSFHTHAKPPSLDSFLHLLCPRCYLQSPLSCFCILNFPLYNHFHVSLKYVLFKTCPQLNMPRTPSHLPFLFPWFLWLCLPHSCSLMHSIPACTHMNSINLFFPRALSNFLVGSNLECFQIILPSLQHKSLKTLTLLFLLKDYVFPVLWSSFNCRWPMVFSSLLFILF